MEPTRPGAWTLRAGRSAALLAAAVVTACGGADGPEVPALAEDDGTPRVFFVEPTDGAAVTSPVNVVMGSRNVEVGAVPAEVEAPRPGVIHYHLGTNTDCLPAGTVIPQADPWIHFGDASNEIEMNFPPGEYRLVLQAGDDEHRTLPDLCEVIQITVVADG